MNLNNIIKKLNILNDLVIQLKTEKEMLKKENEFLKELLISKKVNN